MIQSSNCKSPCQDSKIYCMNIKHGKELQFFMGNNVDVYVIDDTFSDMFSTAFVRIVNLPSTYTGSLETYKMIVYLLYRQLLWQYDDMDKSFASFRKETRDNISKLDSEMILSILEANEEKKK
jgi:hypothetical protein